MSTYFADLPNPGAFDALHNEIRNVFASSFIFDGAKFDFALPVSANLSTRHSFALGSQQIPSSYSLVGVLNDASQKNFVQAHTDFQGMFSLRGQCGLGLKGLIGKAQFQFAPQAPGALQVEFDQTGKSYSSNVKAVNPSPDGTGIFVLSHLQSVSKKLALGLEYVFKKETPQDKMDGQGSFIAKYVGSNFVLTGNLSQIGILQASYFHKVNEKVELGTELQLVALPGRKQGVCTVGAKWEFRQSAFRGQIDSTGKICAAVEERLAPGVAFLMAGEIDHVTGQSKFGVGMTLEGM